MAVHDSKHRVRDCSVRLRRDGRGDPLLYLHGASGLPAWSPFFEKMAERYDVLVPEHPGFGNSDNPAYVRNIADWEAVARVHGQRFGAIRPANTLVQAQLVGEEYLVEIEAEAQIGAGDAL